MPRKILISWVAFYNDFKKGVFKEDGPNYLLHQSHYQDHEKHLLFSTAEEGNEETVMVHTELHRTFPAHQTEPVYLAVKSPVDFKEIKHKAELALRPYKNAEITILSSSGTTPMRMCWFFLHLEKNDYNTRLLQYLDYRLGEGNPRIIPIDAEASSLAYRLEVRIKELEDKHRDKLIPDSLVPAYARAKKIALHPQVSVLIQGESGTGKELLARQIHEFSARNTRKFYAINCAAVGENLLESRLFGFVKGAFTGADKDTAGYFEAASGGTLFLDEIGDISANMQQSLLRVLQEKRIRRIGAHKEIEVDVRIIAATNAKLLQKCEAGEFRWDLYYRLAETEIFLPPLREYSAADRWQMIQHLLQQKQKKYGLKRPLLLDPDIKRWLKTHPFHGNIRELEHVLTNFCIFEEDRKVGQKQLPPSYQQQPEAPLDLEEVIQKHIVYVFHMLDRNITHTTQAVGKAQNTVKKYLRLAGEI